MLPRHQVASNFFALGVSQLANVLAPLVVLPYLARTLSVTELGVVMVVMATVQLAGVVTDYGFNLSAAYAIARHRDDQKFIERLIGAVLGAKTFLALLACLGVCLFCVLSPYSSARWLFVVALIAVGAQAYQPVWFFVGTERMRGVTLISIGTKSSYVLLVLLLVNGVGDGLWVVLAFGVAQVVGAVLGIRGILAGGYRLVAPSVEDVWQTLRDGFEFFGSRVAVAMYSSMSTMLVGTIGGDTQAAYFGLCDQLYKGGQTVTSVASTALFPHMARNKDWKLFWRLVLLLGAAVSTVSLWAGLFAGDILKFVFGSEYVAAQPVLQVVLVTVVINCVSVCFGYPALGALGAVRFANLSTVAGGAVHLLFLGGLVATECVSAFSVAVTILGTETVVMALRTSRVWTLRHAESERLA